MKLTLTAFAALLAAPALAETSFDDLRQCLDDGRVAVVSERTGETLYFNWAGAECANVALSFEPGGGETPVEPAVEEPEPEEPTEEPTEEPAA